MSTVSAKGAPLEATPCCDRHASSWYLYAYMATSPAAARPLRRRLDTPLLGCRRPRSREPADSETPMASRKRHIPGVPASTALGSLVFRRLRPGRRREAALGRATAHGSGWIAPPAGRLSPSPAGRTGPGRVNRQDRSTLSRDAVANGASQLLQGALCLPHSGPRSPWAEALREPEDEDIGGRETPPRRLIAMVESELWGLRAILPPLGGNEPRPSGFLSRHLVDGSSRGR